MTNDAGPAAIPSRFVAWVRTAVGRTTVLILLTGVLAGVSLGIVGNGSIALPVLGSVSGAVVGGVGLLVAVTVYLRVGCCEECDSVTLGSDCGCGGECGDRCAVDP
ncbi:hypothetical protein [Halovivax limisalsi]|uniref:hypothetical protein n=1 Tax=Halovivax limisalsi TaxID=1453760 RepID=UPI001FFCF36E|nr:hypothetical protein [Halovivax limisalsi]